MPSSASEVTYIVSGGALNSTRLPSMPSVSLPFPVLPYVVGDVGFCIAAKTTTMTRVARFRQT